MGTRRNKQKYYERNLKAAQSIVADYNKLIAEEKTKRDFQKAALSNFEEAIKAGDVEVKKLRMLIFDMSIKAANQDGFDTNEEGWQLYQLMDLLNEF